MRPPTLLAAVVLALSSAGCGTFWENTLRNVTEAPIYGANICRVEHRNERLAREAWEAARRAHPEDAYSPDFADGFQAGYADYLESGGNGQPPAVPPFRYRLARYQTPEGYRAIEEWYAGFRAGAAAARDSGLRELFVLPLSAPPINAVETRPGSRAGPPAGASAPPREELPPPRPVEPIGPPRPQEPAAPPALPEQPPPQPAGTRDS